MDNKNIFATNLKKHMALNGKSRKDISEALGISYYTVTDWVKGKKYPRMDKVEMLAQYFGILKSELIEEKNSPDVEENTSREDLEILSILSALPEEKRKELVRYLKYLANN
jgi:repressor LexA